MALTRSMLRGMQLTDEQVNAIIDAHTETVDGLKAERDKYKADAAKLPGIQQELENLKKGDGDDWQEKYNKEHKEFEDFKKEVVGKETLSKVQAFYRTLLTECGIIPKHMDAIMRVTDFKGMKLDKDGKLADSDKLVENIKSEWAGFIANKGTKGAEVDNPPSGGKTTMTKDEILKIKDTSERQKAIAENIELFNGKGE